MVPYHNMCIPLYLHHVAQKTDAADVAKKIRKQFFILRRSSTYVLYNRKSKACTTRYRNCPQNLYRRAQSMNKRTLLMMHGWAQNAYVMKSRTKKLSK